MESVRPNPRCGCPYCRIAGMIVPVVLVTTGVLFLLMEFHAVSIQRSWPVLPLVIMAVKLLQRYTPGKKHLPMGYVSAAPPAGIPPEPSAARSMAFAAEQPGIPSASASVRQGSSISRLEGESLRQ